MRTMKKTGTVYVYAEEPGDNTVSLSSPKSVEIQPPPPDVIEQTTGVAEFDRVCRICASATDYLVPIFCGEGKQNNLAEKISTHLPITVSPQEQLPQNVCVSCAHTLLAWHELVACCRQADAALRTRLDQILQPQEPEPSTSRQTRSQTNKEQTQSGRGAPPLYGPACPYCRPPSAAAPAGVLADLCPAHSQEYFECGECQSFIHRKQLRLHMTLHASHFDSIIDEARKTLVAMQDVNGNKTKKTPAILIKIGPNRAIMVRERRDPPEEGEFADPCDAEGFEPLPDDGLQAIEDSLDDRGDAGSVSSKDPGRDSGGEPRGQKIEGEGYIGPGEAPGGRERDKANDDDGTKSRKARAVKSKRRPRKCPTCDKEYTAASSYFYHLKYAHKAVKDKPCDVCGRKFATDACLKQHKASVHASERAHKCQFCEKTFRSKASAYIHSQTHSGVKAHACGQCPAAFRWRAQLARHAARHAAAAHACARCARRFHVRADLLRHARTHAAPARLPCPAPACAARFAQPRYLQVHLRRRHRAACASELPDKCTD
ncbi:zinc finger protein 275-like [Pectinophora gossypiella]|uniref:zinc finger protein 275-like n=1 Tax=Pectinophora gossypiella TaxID=13191 RepID=UPI00214ECBD9|nr:zinc finger protein 275-like [Pectinophora gossypiella]